MTTALYISFILTILMGVYILCAERKTNMHWALLSNVLCMTIWGLGLVLDIIFTYYIGSVSVFSIYVVYLGITFFPIALWITGLAFKNTNLKLNKMYLLILIVPILTNIVLWTNSYTKWFYKGSFSLVENVNTFGWYFKFVHIPYSYLFVLLWIINMFIYAKKNGGILFKQVALVILGTATQLIINVLFSLNILASSYWNLVAYAFTLLCYLIAMFKYNFLNVVPIAKDKIIDSISDCFVILNKDFEIQDFNRSFKETFKDIISVQLGDNFIKFLECNNFMRLTPKDFDKALENSMSEQVSFPIEVHISKDDFDKWFSIEIVCINRDKDIGSIIIFKNITHQKQNQVILMERTKLRGFAQIAGDLAHDINSPLSVARNVSGDLTDLFEEYQNNPEKIIEKYEWIYSKLQRVYYTCEKSLKIANKLKDQVVYIYNEERADFKLKILILNIMKDIDIKSLLNKLDCKYSINGCPDEVELLGYPENLYKVLKNLIKNAIESYIDKDTEHREIIITVVQENRVSGEVIIISVKDYGCGIDKDLQSDIFNKPLKTKNLKPEGGGISLFFAPLIVIGQLEGSIWFESKEGIGSTFSICIPTTCGIREKERLH